MSIQTQLQAQFDAIALEKLPRVCGVISSVEQFERNQMVCRALREINSSPKCLDDMDEDELDVFQDEVLRIFKHFEWI